MHVWIIGMPFGPGSHFPSSPETQKKNPEGFQPQAKESRLLLHLPLAGQERRRRRHPHRAQRFNPPVYFGMLE